MISGLQTALHGACTAQTASLALPHWQVWAAYSPVKNSPVDAAAKAAGGNPSHSATTGELDMYMTNCKVRKSKLVRNGCKRKCLARVGSVLTPCVLRYEEQWH